MPEEYRRRFPVGAEVVPDGGVHFRVWAPRCERVRVMFSEVEKFGPDPQMVVFEREASGYFSGHVAKAAVGMFYRFLLDDGPESFPDPASRYQPRGPHGASQIVDPDRFAWTDQDWKGVAQKGQVLYEMHVGTFTKEGTWKAAIEHLPALADLGVTVLEVMPVADFPGRFGWGYDGVNLFAPTRLYGTPDDFRQFVDAAHATGLGVILDVVYNHFGPDGNYLSRFSDDYDSDCYECEWGHALNFDGKNSGPVREFFISNARYWIEEFHLDGLRIDATQQIFDSSLVHLLAEIAQAVREAAAPRSVLLVGENEPQQISMLRSLDEGGCELDMLWNDDFHHSAMVAVTRRADAYYSDYRATAQEFIAAAKWGWLYQGQHYLWQKKRRGTPSLSLPPWRLVNFVQNHDQVANSGGGERFHLLTGRSRYRAVTAMLLLFPQTPMLFQGQEFAASAPFFYFADHQEEVARHVAEGRTTFLAQFRILATPEMQARLPDPGDPMTFVHCKLNHDERRLHAAEYALHRDLLALRREDPVLSRQDVGGVDGEVLGGEAFVLRFFAPGSDGDRLLIVNLGRDIHLSPAPQPLLAPPEGAEWEMIWTSEDARYGGWGTPPVEVETGWEIQGEAAVVLRPRLANRE